MNIAEKYLFNPFLVVKYNSFSHELCVAVNVTWSSPTRLLSLLPRLVVLRELTVLDARDTESIDFGSGMSSM